MGWISLAVAAVANTINTISFLTGQKEKGKTLKEQIKQAQEDRDRELQLMDVKFEEAQKTAFKNADRADKDTTFQEGMVALDTNSQVDLLKLGQEQQALNFNMQAMSNASNEGNLLSNLAVSGTRGSSMQDAVDMEKTLNSFQLQNAQDTARKENSLQLSDVLKNLNTNVNNMQYNRTDAMDLRQSFEEGGGQYEIYSLERQNLESRWNSRIKELKDAKDKADDVWGNIWGAVAAAHSVQGLQAGQAVSDFVSNFKGGPDYSTGTKSKAVSYSFNRGNNNNFFGNLDTYNG